MKIVSMVLVLVCVGCASVPFDSIVRVPMGNVVPADVAQDFADKLPVKCDLTSTIVVKYAWKRMSALGYLTLDRQSRSFAMAAVNPMGVKLFEISVKDGELDKVSAPMDLDEKKEFFQAVADDVANAYFDLQPAPDAKVRRGNREVVFVSGIEGGRIEYVFVGAEPVLAEKRYYRGRRLLCRITYHEYFWKNGKLYPRGIALWSKEHHYKLTVRVVEIDGEPIESVLVQKM